MGIKAGKPAMDAILLIADNDARCRGELRRFFSNSGFLVAAVANGLECLAELVALEPDVLVIAMEIPWGGGDGVMARLNDGLPIRSRPLILVIGNAPAETLAARSGVAQCNCFPKPLRIEDLLDRADMDLAIRLRRDAADGRKRSRETTTRIFLQKGVERLPCQREGICRPRLRRHATAGSV
jgi:CheY-like chemotaxis protein